MQTVESPDLHRLLHLAPVQLIAERIREARGDETLDGFGARIDPPMVRTQLIKFEKALNKPRLGTLERIAKASNREVEWFVTPSADAPFRNGKSG